MTPEQMLLIERSRNAKLVEEVERQKHAFAKISVLHADECNTLRAENERLKESHAKDVQYLLDGQDRLRAENERLAKERDWLRKIVIDIQLQLAARIKEIERLASRG